MAVHLSLGALDSSVATSPPSPFDRKTLNALSIVVAKAKRVVVVTGAGISCSSGIPVRFTHIAMPPMLIYVNLPPFRRIFDQATVSML